MGTAAFVLCSSGKRFMDNVVGIVALLGTVPDSNIARMLAVYLGKDDMLSVVCKTTHVADYIEKYSTDGDVDVGFGIHHEAAALGVPIKSRFAVICLDAIEPYNGGLMWNSPQNELDLAWPFPDVTKPKGFKGFAINMINISDENLNITTKSGHGLRETLFYNLFGELQVYETRNDMFKAMNYLKWWCYQRKRETSSWLQPYSDPKITFPVVSGSPETPDELKAHPDFIKKKRQLDEKKKLLESIKVMISTQEESRKELYEKFSKRKHKFHQISEVLFRKNKKIRGTNPASWQ